jgi:hypothetical protein
MHRVSQGLSVIVVVVVVVLLLLGQYALSMTRPQQWHSHTAGMPPELLLLLLPDVLVSSSLSLPGCLSSPAARTAHRAVHNSGTMAKRKDMTAATEAGWACRVHDGVCPQTLSSLQHQWQDSDNASVQLQQKQLCCTYSAAPCSSDNCGGGATALRHEQQWPPLRCTLRSCTSRRPISSRPQLLCSIKLSQLAAAVVLQRLSAVLWRSGCTAVTNLPPAQELFH